MHSLTGKRVLVTGASRGIGRATATAFARCGAEILATDIREEMLTDTAASVRGAGGIVHTFPLDVTDTAAIAALRERIHREGGPVDVVVNNAGVVFGGAFLDVPLAEHLLTYRVNTLGLAAVTHAFLPDLIGRPEAHLVNIASASAFVGLPYGSTYASSKWAVIGFSESIRLELAQLGHRHVGVTAVCPSYVSTGMFDGVRPPAFTRMIAPERLAELILRAVRRNRAFVITPWLVHLAIMLRGIVPLSVLDAMSRAFGTSTSMQSWRGHGR